MAGIEKIRKSTFPPRWLAPLHGGFTPANTSTTLTVGRVMLCLLEVTQPCIVDQIVIINGATVAGNITVGIYGPVVTEETCLGAPVRAQSESTAQLGTSAPQAITIPATYLNPGRYYVAFELSDATATIMRQGQGSQVTGYVQYYDRSGGYGALTNPCPAITQTTGNAPGLKIRCSPVNI